MAVAILAIGLTAAKAQASTERLTYRGGVDAIEHYAERQPGNHRIERCVRRNPTSVACHVEWQNVEIGEELNVAGVWVPAYGDFWDWVITKQWSATCVKVWEPIFDPKYAETCVKIAGQKAGN